MMPCVPIIQFTRYDMHLKLHHVPRKLSAIYHDRDQFSNLCEHNQDNENVNANEYNQISQRIYCKISNHLFKFTWLL